MDEPTCWIVFPVYRTSASQLKTFDPADLAGRYSDTLCDELHYAEHGNATVVEFDPLTITDCSDLHARLTPHLEE